jgi:DNA-binding response OmpR family regulator
MPDPARIFIVEDEYLIRLLLEDMLSELGYAVGAIASNLDEGKSKAETAEIDIALLDVNIDGEQVFPIAEILRGRGKPFIFVTGYGAQGLPENYRGNPTLQKPMQMQDLKAMLVRTLGPR